jgi:uncharacterized protein YdcH (DUF465 family)
MDADLSTIKDSFPKWSSSIERLYQDNASFRSLCEDYLLLIDQICKHSDLDPPISSADKAELKLLLNELEQEMFIYLEGV